MPILRVELGCPGHFILARDCRWRRHTQVGEYRVSSVGNLYYPGDPTRKTIGGGSDDYFETLVFKTTSDKHPNTEDCGCRDVTDWCEIDGQRYGTAGEAQEGHEQFIEKYLKLQTDITNPTSQGVQTV